MYIEFYGLPGSGKSLVFSKLKKNKDYFLIETFPLYKRLFYSFIFIFFHPVISFRLFRNLYCNLETYNKTNIIRMILSKFIGIYLSTLAKYQKYLLNSKKICIVDEGFYQLIFASFDKENTRLKSALEYVDPLVEHLIIITSDDELREKRMLSRGKIPREEFGSDYTNEWLKTSLDINKKIETHIKKDDLGLIIENSKDIDKVLKKIENYIKNIK